MNFAEAESYLFSLGNEVETMKLGLANITALLDELGRPQEKYLKVQVAGTNGKGSVCAFIDSICLEAGMRTGVFTSPHLVSVTERVKIAGKEIGEPEFARFTSQVKAASEMMVASDRLERLPTFFEQMTAIALLAFADAGVELTVLETGLGGRYDATTAANAEFAVITRIDLDHQEYLGETIEQIAAEKAAIIRPDTVAAVVSDPFDAAGKVVVERCVELGVPCFSGVGVTTTVKNDEVNIDPFGVVEIGLKGRHQIENARTAIRTVELLLQNGNEFPIGVEHVVRGLKNARHPGRLEYEGQWLFDGAHNANGAHALATYLTENENRPTTLVFGVMRDKNVADMANVLFPIAENIILTAPTNPRAMGPAEILKSTDRELWRRKVVKPVGIDETVRTAENFAGNNGVIVVAGSLYLVGELKKLLVEEESKSSI